MEEKKIDYKLLLLKYMYHINELESTYFLSKHLVKDLFNEQELKELKRISQEVESFENN